jgi:TolB protein
MEPNPPRALAALSLFTPVTRALVTSLAALALVACTSTYRVGLRATEAAVSLEQVTHGDGREMNPAISRDGKLLAFETLGEGGVRRIATMSLTASSVSPPRVAEGTGEQVAWMPDSEGLVFVAPLRGAPALVQTFGQTASSSAFWAPVADPYLRPAWPSVSPNGRAIAMSLVSTHVFESQSGRREWLDPALVVSDLQGTGVVAMGLGSEPSWNPDGSRLVFVRRAPSSSRTHLYVSEPKAQARAQPITDGPDDDAHPAWSPDGALIAFCSSPAVDGAAPRSNLFVVRPDGSGLRQVTEGDAMACRPAWAPGQTLYFHAQQDGQSHIWRLRMR